ncbi:MAG: hypothetical protein PW735_10805 [Acidobacteriaceae bacterium]|nr:hypothetical protein [Acidobacteriaceae bacterium]
MLSFPLTIPITLSLFLLGATLIAVELNRPGLIVAGAVGLLMTLLSLASIVSMPQGRVVLDWYLIAFGLMLQDFRRSRLLWALSAAFCWAIGFWRLTGHPLYSLAGIALATGTAILARIARRARLNKGLD